MKLIDKDALVAEIRKRLLPVNRDKHYDEWEEGQDSERIAILDIIDRFEVKDVDLEKEFDNYTKKIKAEIERRKSLADKQSDCIYNHTLNKSKFKIGDIFTKKYTRDTIPIEIYEISYGAIEPIYKLKPIRLCGDDVILGEEALIELYNKIN